MYYDLPPYIKGDTKKAQENRTEMIFANFISNQLIINRLAKLEASLSKRPLKDVLKDIDEEGEHIAADAVKELEAYYEEG